MLEAVSAWALGFVLTWLIESIVYLWAFRVLGWLPGPTSVTRGLLVVLGLNVATHPLLWWFTSAVPGVLPLLVAEAGVVAVEGSILGLVFRRRDEPGRWGWAYLAALLANAVSLLLGLVGGLVLRAVAGAGSSACC